jgi:hypothetical protein
MATTILARRSFSAAAHPTRRTAAVLWGIQGVLAALFLFAGGTKLVMPAAALAQQSTLPIWFVRFIGVAEVAGALGLILPGLTGIRPRLTPLAAAGLVIIMLGATAVTLTTPEAATAIIPAVVGLLAMYVVYGRTRVSR